jgi:hypothetical protein
LSRHIEPAEFQSNQASLVLYWIDGDLAHSGALLIAGAYSAIRFDAGLRNSADTSWCPQDQVEHYFR